jgi:hypothetical protein
MTKKDFEMIASTLKSEMPEREPGNRWSDGARDEWSTTCLAFASMLASTNPRFDRARFLAACGMES